MTTNLEGLAAAARKLATDLFQNRDETGCVRIDSTAATGSKNCLTLEEERPLTSAEKKLDWVRRPFYAYLPGNMCLACSSYWHVELAAQDLHKLNCLKIREEARAGLKAAAEGRPVVLSPRLVESMAEKPPHWELAKRTARHYYWSMVLPDGRTIYNVTDSHRAPDNDIREGGYDLESLVEDTERPT